MTDRSTTISEHNEVLTRLYWEATSTDLQNNLEGTGLVVWKYLLPTESAAFTPLINIGFAENEARAFVSEILNSLRLSGIISGKPGVDLGQEIFQPRTGPLFIREKEPNKAIKTYAWLPKSASNTRVDYARKVFEKLNISADPTTVLSGIWSALSNPSGLLQGLLSTESKGTQGIVFSLNPAKVLLESSEKAGAIFQCELCRRITAVSAGDVCPRFKCSGKLNEVSAGQLKTTNADSHYASLYNN